MTHSSYGPITEIESDAPNVHAFRVSGHIDDDASEALAKHMNGVFDGSDKVNMLLDLTCFTGSDWDSWFDGDVITSRFRALSHVKRYAVIGAPEKAAKMINLIDKVIPVEAKAFDASNAVDTWEFVGARPIAATA
ncbi:MAG: STAS/SEC14 domain-containing protein [Sulfitobacter sp.]